jgi:phenylacetate-CoA ligase
MGVFFDDLEERSALQRKTDQNRRLSEMIAAAYRHSSRVKETMDGLDLKPRDIASADDLEKLPVISREDLVERERLDPPFGGLCAPDADVARIFTSPGPVYEPHLGEGQVWARGYFAGGVRRGDRVRNTFS